ADVYVEVIQFIGMTLMVENPSLEHLAQPAVLHYSPLALSALIYMFSGSPWLEEWENVLDTIQVVSDDK
ncbi:hypothetical protein C0993_002518, partial [Termitomyces sp. T159_Od127]